MADLLDEIRKVPLVFQRLHITISAAVTKIESVQLRLTSMLDQPAINVTTFTQDIQGNQYKDITLLHEINLQTLERGQGLIQKVIQWLEKRFNSLQIIRVLILTNFTINCILSNLYLCT